MATRFQIALGQFQARETAALRGRYFFRVARRITTEKARHGVSQRQIVDWFGPPDLYCESGAGACYVYRFDHTNASKQRDE